MKTLKKWTTALSCFERQTLRYAIFETIEDEERRAEKLYSEQEISALRGIHRLIDSKYKVEITTTFDTRRADKCL
jgi:hypothetical protein